MRHPGSHRFFPLLAAALSSAAGLFLSGCLFGTETKVAGGAQDFPNTVALGMAASSHISDHVEWDQFSAIPSALPGFSGADSLIVAPESLSAKPKTGAGAGGVGGAVSGFGAGKSGAAAAALSDTVYWDLSDTAALKVARRIHEQETLLRIKGDTLTFRYDDKAKDSVIGNELILEAKGAELWKASERRLAWRYENTDSAGGFDRGTFHERLPAFAPAGFRVRHYVSLAGPDDDIAAKGDNLPVHYAFIRTRTVAGASPDTLESFDIVDADGDGTLWGAGDSGVVDFRQQTPTPALRPSVESVTQRMRAVLFKEEGKTYPISFRETRIEKDGRKVAWSVRGFRNGIDSTFAPGDTVVVAHHVEFPEAARLVEKTARYRVILGDAPKKFSDNALLRYSLDAVWRKDLATTKFVFTPDAPVASRELSITGGLELTADFGSGHTAEAMGRYENKVIDVVLNDFRPDGKKRRFRIDWDALGKVLKQTVLE
ncbi:MAG: hypothetical protein JWP91_442 [Fibrobacteres bacterium]|nr:hypothetical protein [Fibrobacterota bacterium]